MTRTKHEFSAQGSDLLAAVRWTEKAVDKSSAGLLSIKVENGQMILEAYNGIHSAVSKVPVNQPATQTRFSVESKMFLDSIKNMGNATVEMVFSGNQLTISAPKIRVTLPVTVPRSTPSIPDMPARMGTVESEHFTAMLGHATMTASDDPSAPALTTVHFEVDPANSVFKMMSTDRYRMVIRTVHYTVDPNAATEPFNFDIDSAALKNLITALGEVQTLELFAAADGANILGVGTPTTQGSVLMKDVKPINYQQFLKMSPQNYLLLERKEILSAISTTRNLMTGTIKAGTITISNDDVTLVSDNKDRTGFGTNVGLEHHGHTYDDTYSVIMNLDYVYSLLRAGSSKFVRFCSDIPHQAAQIQEMKDETTPDPDYFSIFIPIRA